MINDAYREIFNMTKVVRGFSVVEKRQPCYAKMKGRFSSRTAFEYSPQPLKRHLC